MITLVEFHQKNFAVEKVEVNIKSTDEKNRSADKCQCYIQKKFGGNAFSWGSGLLSRYQHNFIDL